MWVESRTAGAAVPRSLRLMSLWVASTTASKSWSPPSVVCTLGPDKGVEGEMLVTSVFILTSRMSGFKHECHDTGPNKQ